MFNRTYIKCFSGSPAGWGGRPPYSGPGYPGGPPRPGGPPGSWPPSDRPPYGPGGYPSSPGRPGPGVRPPFRPDQQMQRGPAPRPVSCLNEIFDRNDNANSSFVLRWLLEDARRTTSLWTVWSRPSHCCSGGRSSPKLMFSLLRVGGE